MSSEKRRAPAFQFYADDFLAGTLDLSQADVGAYIRLLCHQWNRGSIPVETEKQQRLAGGSVSVDVLAKFRLVDGSRLVNERLEQERQKQANYRELQRQKGKLSAESRQNQPEVNRGSTEPPTGHPTGGQLSVSVSVSVSVYGFQLQTDKGAIRSPNPRGTGSCGRQDWIASRRGRRVRQLLRQHWVEGWKDHNG